MLIFDHGTVLLYNIVVMLVTAVKDVDNANDSKFTKKNWCKAHCVIWQAIRCVC